MRQSSNGADHNRRYWDAMFATDPKHVKRFKRPGFSGTAVDPIHRIEKMTETFGPCGVGWGIGEPTYQLVTDPSGSKPDTIVYCTVGVWVERPDNLVFGVGGDKCIKTIAADPDKHRPERVEFDDEAFKKAHTDAIGNALVKLGNSADVHLGLYDDNKYVREMQQEFSEKPDNSPRPLANGGQPPLPNRRAAKEAVKANTGPPAEPTVPDLSDMVTLTDRHGNAADFSVSGEPSSIMAAVETDLVDSAANGGLEDLREAWKRHFHTVERLPKEMQERLDLIKERLKARYAPENREPIPEAPPDDLPDIPKSMDRRGQAA